METLQQKLESRLKSKEFLQMIYGKKVFASCSIQFCPRYPPRDIRIAKLIEPDWLFFMFSQNRIRSSSFDEEQEEEDDAWKVFPVKLRQPVPGSKIDILKSSIEKQVGYFAAAVDHN